METLHGRLEGVAPGRAMLLTRELSVTVDELWRWITESSAPPGGTARGAPRTEWIRGWATRSW